MTTSGYSLSTMGEPSVAVAIKVETLLAVAAEEEEGGLDPVGGSHRNSTIRGSRPSAAAIPTAAIWG